MHAALSTKNIDLIVPLMNRKACYVTFDKIIYLLCEIIYVTWNL